MARTKVESELAERVIDFLIREASESGGKKFRLKEAVSFFMDFKDVNAYETSVRSKIFKRDEILLLKSPKIFKRDEIEILLKGLQKNIFNWEIIPKAIITEDDLVFEFTKDLNKYLTLENVKSIVIDVVGLHERYATQIEIYRNGEIVYSPSKNRNEEGVKLLVECLSYTAS